MIASHVHDALEQVRRLQTLVIERKNFKGYSGRSRIFGGLAAFAGAAVMSMPSLVAETESARLCGWGVVLAVGLLLNYGSLLHWFLYSPEARRSLGRLVPALDALPALAVGAFFSLGLVVHGNYELLPGVWMALYGLVHVPYRNNLPAANYLVGVFYMLSGAYFFLFPAEFANPWPMGVVFFVGETFGGCVLMLDARAKIRDEEE